MVFNVPPAPFAHPLGTKFPQLVPAYNPIDGACKPVIETFSVGPVIVTLYHTSAEGEGMLPDGWHPTNDVYGCSAVAQRLVVLKYVHGPTPLLVGQTGGVGRVPRFCAPAQGSFVGGAPPLHEVVQGAVLGHGTQLMDAAKPGAVTIISDVNTSVMHPLVAVTVPGDVIPL